MIKNKILLLSFTSFDDGSGSEYTELLAVNEFGFIYGPAEVKQDRWNRRVSSHVVWHKVLLLCVQRRLISDCSEVFLSFPLVLVPGRLILVHLHR